MTYDGAYKNQRRLSNRLCEYCHEVDVIVIKAFNFTTKTYEVIEKSTNKVHKCLGREIDKQYNKKDIPILRLGNERII
jgi:hypothetical protein